MTRCTGTGAGGGATFLSFLPFLPFRQGALACAAASGASDPMANSSLVGGCAVRSLATTAGAPTRDARFITKAEVGGAGAPHIARLPVGQRVMSGNMVATTFEFAKPSSSKTTAPVQRRNPV